MRSTNPAGMSFLDEIYYSEGNRGRTDNTRWLFLRNTLKPIDDLNHYIFSGQINFQKIEKPFHLNEFVITQVRQALICYEEFKNLVNNDLKVINDFLNNNNVDLNGFKKNIFSASEDSYLYVIEKNKPDFFKNLKEQLSGFLVFKEIEELIKNTSEKLIFLEDKIKKINNLVSEEAKTKNLEYIEKNQWSTKEISKYIEIHFPSLNLNKKERTEFASMLLQELEACILNEIYSEINNQIANHNKNKKEQNQKNSQSETDVNKSNFLIDYRSILNARHELEKTDPGVARINPHYFESFLQIFIIKFYKKFNDGYRHLKKFLKEYRKERIEFDIKIQEGCCDTAIHTDYSKINLVKISILEAIQEIIKRRFNHHEKNIVEMNATEARIKFIEDKNKTLLTETNPAKAITDTFHTPVCQMAVIIDSEGNAVTLHQLARKK